MTFYLLSLLLGIIQCQGKNGVQLITRPIPIPFSHYLNLLNPPITILIRTNQGDFTMDLPGRAKASDLYRAAELRGFSDGTFWYSGKELVYDDPRRLSKVGIGFGSVIYFLLNPGITILIETKQGGFSMDLPEKAKVSDLYEAAQLNGLTEGTFWYSGKELMYDDHRRLIKMGISSGSVIEFDDFDDDNDIEDELAESFPMKDPKTAMVIIQNLLERTPVVGRGYTYTDFIVLKLRRDVGFDIILDEVSVRVERTENGMTGTFHLSGIDLCIDNLEIRDDGTGDVSFLLDIRSKGPESVNHKTTTIVIHPKMKLKQK